MDLARWTLPDGPCQMGLARGASSQCSRRRDLVTGFSSPGCRHRVLVKGTLSQVPCQRVLVSGTSCRRDLVTGPFSEGSCQFGSVAGTVSLGLVQVSCHWARVAVTLSRHPRNLLTGFASQRVLFAGFLSQGPCRTLRDHAAGTLPQEPCQEGFLNRQCQIVSRTFARGTLSPGRRRSNLAKGLFAAAPTTPRPAFGRGDEGGAERFCILKNAKMQKYVGIRAELPARGVEALLGEDDECVAGPERGRGRQGQSRTRLGRNGSRRNSRGNYLFPRNLGREEARRRGPDEPAPFSPLR
jgi:hypothetical protein